MYTILDIQSFLSTEYKNIFYKEIIFLRKIIHTTIENNDLHLLNIIYHNNINIRDLIDINQLVCYQKHLEKLKNCNISIKLLKDIYHAHKITTSYIYIIKLITSRKKIEFAKLLSDNFKNNTNKFMNINSDVIYMILNLI